MDNKKLKSLVENAINIDPENEVQIEENAKQRLALMKENLEDTISYLNTCSEIELLWATEILEDLSEYYKSDKLIKCVENNAKRCQNTEIESQLRATINYMKQYI